MKGRILCFDFGRKRMGIAVTDPLQIIATPLETIHPDKTIDFLRDYFKKDKIEELVIGLPLKNNSELNEIETDILKLIKKIKIHFPELVISRYDERFTSRIATDSLLTAGAKKNQRRDKALVDKMSAAIILQDYLGSKL